MGGGAGGGALSPAGLCAAAGATATSMPLAPSSEAVSSRVAHRRTGGWYPKHSKTMKWNESAMAAQRNGASRWRALSSDPKNSSNERFSARWPFKTGFDRGGGCRQWRQRRSVRWGGPRVAKAGRQRPRRGIRAGPAAQTGRFYRQAPYCPLTPSRLHTHAPLGALAILSANVCRFGGGGRCPLKRAVGLGLSGRGGRRVRRVGETVFSTRCAFRGQARRNGSWRRPITALAARYVVGRREESERHSMGVVPVLLGEMSPPPSQMMV